MLAGTGFSYLTTIDPSRVRRKDGRPVARFEPVNARTELGGLIAMLKNWKIMTILPISMGESLTLSCPSYD